jgi:hypothetical protein
MAADRGGTGEANAVTRVIAWQSETVAGATITESSPIPRTVGRFTNSLLS